MEELKYLRDDEREMLERAEKATPGPWICRTPPPFDAETKSGMEHFEPEPHVVHVFTDEERRRHTQFVASCNGATLPNAENAQMIAHSREDVPELLLRLNEAREELAEQWIPVSVPIPEDGESELRLLVVDRTRHDEVPMHDIGWHDDRGWHRRAEQKYPLGTVTHYRSHPLPEFPPAKPIDLLRNFG